MSARAESARAGVWSLERTAAGLGARLRGPGGLYNLGNAIGLAVGLLLQVRSAGAGGDAVAASLAAYFVGDGVAVALTLATLFFFWSGEAYHRAWANGLPPDARRTRRGDLLSGVGAAFLGVGLLMVGDPVLAATSGLLHAAGKFASALDLRPAGNGRTEARDRHRLYRWAVVASRAPATLIGLIGVAAVLLAPGGVAVGALLVPATLVVCYALWTAADLMLLHPARG